MSEVLLAQRFIHSASVDVERAVMAAYRVSYRWLLGQLQERDCQVARLSLHPDSHRTSLRPDGSRILSLMEKGNE